MKMPMNKLAEQNDVSHASPASTRRIASIDLIRGEVSPWLFTNHPMGNPPPPEGYAWSLPLLYLIFVIAIALLYFPCRWFAALKARRNDWWLRYL